MDKLDSYRESVKTLLSQYANALNASGTEEIETEMIFDEQRDHYQLVNVGWRNGRRVYGCTLHIDIKAGKVWVQYNGTEMQVADELVQMGVAKKDIVLGFQSPLRRELSGFAIG